MVNSQVVYTIGYAHHSQESFLALLKQYGVQCVIDVRTMAYSGYHPQFNKQPLKYFLNENGILYRQMDEAFGIVRPNTDLLNVEGYLDFKKVAKTPAFISGIETIKRGIAAGFCIVLMCAEKSPIDCHRSTLVARALVNEEIAVYHILHDGKLQSHMDMEKELVERYFPKEPQLFLFEQSNEKELLERAYEKRSNEIVEVNAKRVLKERYQSPKSKS